MQRRRLRELGITVGRLAPGRHNSLTDVPGVQVGHLTLVEGDRIRTGATAILPHAGNLYQNKAPAGLAVGNGFGKLLGATQIVELGEIESPILLTNTLAVTTAGDAILDWTLAQPGNEEVRTVNAVAGETNDGKLSDIRARTLTTAHMLKAITAATGDPVVEGCVGAGTGTVALGWKGGIGTSSRIVETLGRRYVVGALVQSNVDGLLQIKGRTVAPEPHSDPNLPDARDPAGDSNSIMIVIATDLPLSDRNLTRLARRAMAGLARTGANMSNGSGDYALAFSIHPDCLRTPARRRQVTHYPDLPNQEMTIPFLAAVEATEEAILNSLCMARTTTGCGRTIPAVPPAVLASF